MRILFLAYNRAAFCTSLVIPDLVEEFLVGSTEIDMRISITLIVAIIDHHACERCRFYN